MNNQKNKKVIVFGTFDLLHKGHLNFFEQAKKKGDYLMVVVARDKTVEKVKDFKPKFLENIRKDHIKELKIVDKAVLGNIKDKYLIIKKYQPDIICIGYDQKVNLQKLKDKIKDFGLNTKIFKLKSHKPEIYKSSKLK